MATNTLYNKTSPTFMDAYVHSILQCHVALDRLEQTTIDHAMTNLIERDVDDDDTTVRTALSLGDGKSFDHLQRFILFVVTIATIDSQNISESVRDITNKSDDDDDDTHYYHHHENRGNNRQTSINHISHDRT